MHNFYYGLMYHEVCFPTLLKSSWRWKQRGVPKFWYLTIMHKVITQKISTIIPIIVKTWNLALICFTHKIQNRDKPDNLFVSCRWGSDADINYVNWKCSVC